MSQPITLWIAGKAYTFDQQDMFKAKNRFFAGRVVAEAMAEFMKQQKKANGEEPPPALRSVLAAPFQYLGVPVHYVPDLPPGAIFIGAECELCD